MRPIDARTVSRLPSTIALVAAVWMLVIIADSTFPWLEAVAPHHPHAVTSSHIANSDVIYDHAHIEPNSVTAPPETLAVAPPPRVGTQLAAVGLALAFVVAVALLAHNVLPVMRGPPRAFAALLTGQQVVTRFCIARR